MNKQALQAMYELLEAARDLTDDAPNGTPRFEALREVVEKIDNLIGNTQ